MWPQCSPELIEKATFVCVVKTKKRYSLLAFTALFIYTNCRLILILRQWERSSLKTALSHIDFESTDFLYIDKRQARFLCFFFVFTSYAQIHNRYDCNLFLQHCWHKMKNDLQHLKQSFFFFFFFFWNATAMKFAAVMNAWVSRSVSPFEFRVCRGECRTMFGLKWLRSDPKTLKCNLNEIGLMTENNLESLRREKFIIFHFMALSAWAPLLCAFGR